MRYSVPHGYPNDLMAEQTRQSPLDAFLPSPDVREHHRITVRAPASFVYEACRVFDMQSVFLVRATFRLRALLLGAADAQGWKSDGLFTDVRRMGWGILVDEPPHLFVAGANCQPWRADVRFTPRSGDIRTFAAPEQVKIAWSLEVEASGPEECRLHTETRAQATDAAAHRRFMRYWRWARFGIIGIRLLLLPAIRREAEARYRRDQVAAGSHSRASRFERSARSRFVFGDPRSSRRRASDRRGTRAPSKR